MTNQELFNDAYLMRPLLFGTNATAELLYCVRRFQIKGSTLELGCGDGRDTLHLLDAGLSVTAVDYAASAIETMKGRPELFQYLENGSLIPIVSDVTKCDLLSGMYNFICGVTIIDHLSYTHMCQLVEGAKNSIQKGGYIFFQVHTKEDDGYSGRVAHSEFSYQIHHYFSTNELLHLFEKDCIVRFYQESIEDDYDHGPAHKHAFASILVQK